MRRNQASCPHSNPLTTSAIYGETMLPVYTTTHSPGRRYTEKPCCPPERTWNHCPHRSFSARWGRAQLCRGKWWRRMKILPAFLPSPGLWSSTDTLKWYTSEMWAECIRVAQESVICMLVFNNNNNNNNINNNNNNIYNNGDLYSAFTTISTTRFTIVTYK